jgi:hypothetical protein
MLSLPKVKKGHHGSFLVLGRVSFQDLLNKRIVLLTELERDAGIVLRCISMLGERLSVSTVSN